MFQTKLPEAFINRMNTLLGPEADAFYASYEKEARHGLFLNAPDGQNERLLSLFEALGLSLGDPVPWEEGGRYYEDLVPFGKHIFHEGGFYYIQEPSAMAPVSFLAPRPGERILDLCAAPGGKTTQIGVKMKGEGLLISNEIHPQRSEILSENVERMGLANAVVTNASPDQLSARFPLFFDRILVDAPCSGEGMFRKNEDAIQQWSEDNVRLCAERQLMILEHADLMLKMGGYLAYSTCTFSPEENENLIHAFLERHPLYHLLPMPLSGGMTRGLDPNHPDSLVRLFPHKVEGEGHFAALLQKKAAMSGASVGYNTPVEAPSKSLSDKKSKKKKGGGQSEDLTALFAFLKDVLSDAPASPAAKRLSALTPQNADSLLFFRGSQVYLLPDPVLSPLLACLKVQRPGLHLGSLEKGRFQPSLALARALLVDDIIYYVNLNAGEASDRSLLQSYFEGNTFPYDGEKGWYLICMEGRGMGWGKLAGGIMKNHYPKGLRKKLLS